MSVKFPFRSRKIVAQKLSSNFREATRVEEFEVRAPQKDEVVVQMNFVGINASDINFTAGQCVPVLLLCGLVIHVVVISLM